MELFYTMRQFFIFALCAGVLVFFLSYDRAKKSHFYTNEANFTHFYPNEYAHFSPSSSLITPPTKAAHSSTLVQTSLGLMALFFAGTREGARDVAIYQSFYDEKNNQWSEPKSLLDAPTLSKLNAKFIKKLGNPTAFKDAKDTIHLFVVGVSLGGWATSKIYHFEFDENFNLHFKKELSLGALSNFSHLVRNPPILLENDGFILPIYHELVRKYPLLAFFDEKGKLLYTKRINTLKNQLQPSLIAFENECLAFFRNHKAYESVAFLQGCENSANTWQKPIKTNLKNYDSSSVLSLIFSDKRAEILLIHNDGQKGKARSTLSLFWLKDKAKGEFVKLFTLDEAQEVSYPAVLSSSNSLYISYTLDRKAIKVQRLSTFDLLQAIERAKEKE